MKILVSISLLVGFLLAPWSASATDNNLIVDQYLLEISEDKAKFDDLYEHENVAITFGTCFDKLNINIFGVRNAPGDYKKFGYYALTKPYIDFASPLFTDNHNDLTRLKATHAMEVGEIVDAMERYRISVRDIERILEKECMLWAFRDKWDIDHGVNVSKGSSLTDEQLAISRTSPYLGQFSVQRSKQRDDAVKRAGAVRPFANIGSNASTNRPKTIAELVAELEKHVSPAGPMPREEEAVSINAQALQKFQTDLESLYLHPGDWAYLIDTHFYADAKFDPSKWSTFVDFSLRSGFNLADQQAAAKLDSALVNNLKIPLPAVELLRVEFFKSKTLRRLNQSDEYGGNYEYYVLDKLFHRSKAFNDALDDESRKLLEKFQNSADSTPKMPEIRAARPGDGKRDCSWNAVLASMKAADPSFAQKWGQYFTMGNVMTFLGPGGAAGTSGSGSAFKRSILVAGVREAKILCEAGKT